MGESGPQETLGDETEEIARRLQTVIYVDISLVHSGYVTAPRCQQSPLFGTGRNWMFA
jgi:hypothetical protein